MQQQSKSMAERQHHAPIAEAMKTYAADGALAFHTPGHKQGLGAHPLLRELITAQGLREEVSLMEELDDFHEPQTCIREAQELAADLYGADHAFFSINGTTGAIHAMMLGTLRPGDTVLVPRNAHRSVVGGLILAGAVPVYIQPEIDRRLGIPMGLRLSDIRRAAEAHPEARALLAVYPTYYGVTVDLRAIADFLHARGMLLLVDEAHGPHLRFCTGLPPQALDCGADVVAESTHKIVGSMTQTSMLFTKGPRVDAECVRQAASLVQSTSPNQLLLASLDIARLQLAEDGERLVGRAVHLAEKLREAVQAIDGLGCFGAEDMQSEGASGLDTTKLTVTVTGLGLTGTEAEHILRYEEKIQCELSDPQNVLFILSYADTEETCRRLLEALRHLAAHRRPLAAAVDCFAELPLPERAMTPREAFFAAAESVPFAEAEGRVAAEQVMFYPPGIPLLAPGERITRRVMDYIRSRQAIGLKISGPEDVNLKKIKVIRGNS